MSDSGGPAAGGLAEHGDAGLGQDLVPVMFAVSEATSTSRYAIGGDRFSCADDRC